MSGLGYIARHTATAYTNAASILFQLSTAAGGPITINRIELQSSVTTSSQAVVVVQAGYYATGSAAGGSTPTPQPLSKKNTVSSTVGVRIATATMGTTFTPYFEWQWNIALPFDYVLGMEDLKINVPASTAWALILPSASGTPTLSGGVSYSEY